MTDPSSHQGSGDDPSEPSDEASPPGMPRWVKVSALVVVGLLVVLLIMRFTGLAGDHGPGRHGPGMHRPGGDSLTDLVVDRAACHVSTLCEGTVIGGLVVDAGGPSIGLGSVPGQRQAGTELGFVAVAPEGGPPPMGH